MKAKKGLLDAKRKGELEKIADGMEKTSKNMVRQAGDISALKRKVAQGILAAHRDGELETMALEMHKTQHSVEKKAAELKELKLKVKKGLLDAHRTGGLETIAKGLEEEAERKAAEFRALKLKARRNLLEGKRDGWYSGVEHSFSLAAENNSKFGWCLLKMLPLKSATTSGFHGIHLLRFGRHFRFGYLREGFFEMPSPPPIRSNDF